VTSDVRNLLRLLRVPGLAYRDLGAMSVAPPARTRERREGLVTIALVSLVPGVGRTVLCANLRDALSRAGARAGAVDLDPGGALETSFGADGREPAACIEQFAAERDVLLLDTASPPPEDVLIEADDVVVVARADARSLAAVGPMEELLVRTRMRSWRKSRARWLVNGFDGRRRTDRDCLAAFRRSLGGRVLATVIQEDRALRSAFAVRKVLRQVAPSSQVVRDLDALARELFVANRTTERDARIG
jgi:cellulose biosynthesis protein BcsQ